MGNHVYYQGLAKEPRALRMRRPARVGVGVCAPTPTNEDADRFFAHLMEVTGLPNGTYRQPFLYRRLPACLRMLGVPNTSDGTRKMHRCPQLAHDLLNVVLLGVTEFRRDPEVFDFIENEVLPDWEPGKPLRIWSAACSAGQELYSMAMLVAKMGLLERAELLGTDCRPEAVARAAVGRFDYEALVNVEPAWREVGFTAAGSAVVVKKTLRDAVRWRVSDLLKGPERGPWDIILWRNMAIYLEPTAGAAVWKGIVSELAPGGCLITGKADHPPRDAALLRIAPCIYQKLPK